MGKASPTITVTFLDGKQTRFQAEAGTNLRQALLQQGISPYTSYTRRLNCGGRGLCATCGVWINGNAPAPQHWHDKAARRFGYPRLSCQVTIEQDLQVELVEKWIWGGRRSL
ncbi:MAG: 2Fe-2S iron-sulfur cluster-binding protein [bacterium]|nr:2Fe-2S iron-sulfur cluster-binding protein [bacterium]